MISLHQVPYHWSLYNVYCIGRCLDVGIRQSIIEVATLTGLEMCNGFPDATYLGQEASRTQFTRAIGAILHAMRQNNAWSPINMVTLSPAAIERLGTGVPAINEEEQAQAQLNALCRLIIGVADAYKDHADIVFEAAYAIGLHMSQHLIGNIISPPAIIASRVAAVMRRGSLTEA